MQLTSWFVVLVICFLLIALFPLWERINEKLETVREQRKRRVPREWKGPFQTVRDNLDRMGISVSTKGIQGWCLGIFVGVFLLVFILKDPISLALIVASVVCIFAYSALLLYSRRFERRFFKGLVQAIPIGIDALIARNELNLALEDIISLSNDTVMQREMSLILQIWKGSNDSISEIMLRRATKLKVDEYLRLATLTREAEAIGASIYQVWKDQWSLLDEEQKDDEVKASKTAFTRYFALGASGLGLIAFVIFYRQLAPQLTGGFLGIFIMVAISVAFGLIRLARM